MLDTPPLETDSQPCDRCSRGQTRWFTAGLHDRNLHCDGLAFACRMVSRAAGRRGNRWKIVTMQSMNWLVTRSCEPIFRKTLGSMFDLQPIDGTDRYRTLRSTRPTTSRCHAVTIAHAQSSLDGSQKRTAKRCRSQFASLSPPARHTRSSLADTCPISDADGNFVRPGYDAALDEMRESRQRGANNGSHRINNRWLSTRAFTNLKVGFNKVFGYT